MGKEQAFINAIFSEDLATFEKLLVNTNINTLSFETKDFGKCSLLMYTIACHGNPPPETKLSNKKKPLDTLPFIQSLLEQFVDLEFTNNIKETAFTVAKVKKNEDITKLLNEAPKRKYSEKLSQLGILPHKRGSLETPGLLQTIKEEKPQAENKKPTNTTVSSSNKVSSTLCLIM